ncbi:MAG: cytochrome P450 [Segniliparus sp.]|uniref:cytochrome P450 n=1 Tax=Segniliparus sp. TaxID=2804064 RepID=UPI003F3BCE30
MSITAEEAVAPGPSWPAWAQTALTFSRGWWLGTGLLRRRYGDVFRLRLYRQGSGSLRNVLVLADPEHMREVFAGSPKSWHVGDGNLLRPVLGEHSLLVVDEDVHARIRKLLMPSFTVGALRGYATMFEALAEADVERWPTGRTIRAHEHTQRLTLDIILHTVFGVSDPKRSATLRPLLARILRPRAADALWILQPGLERIGVGRAYHRELVRLNRLMEQEIAERRTDPALHERADVLSRMTAANVDDDRLSDEELRDQLVTLVIAGYETTAKALAWCLLDLAHNPAAQQEAQRAADSGDLGHLTAVFKESLRLHPVVAGTARQLVEPMRVAGRLVPKGWSVFPWLSAPHFDGRYFPDPKAFRPERFLGEHPPSNHHWQPFGGGVRRCIGAAFSQAEAAVILKSALSRYSVEPVAAEMEGDSRIPNIVIGPRLGALVRLTRREKAPQAAG